MNILLPESFPFGRDLALVLTARELIPAVDIAALLGVAAARKAILAARGDARAVARPADKEGVG